MKKIKLKVLVVGCAGFIGSHLAEGLLKAGHQVWGFDNLATGKIENVPKGVEFILGDILYIDNLRLEGIDVIYHLAALPRVQFSINNPKQTNDVNIGGTLRVLEWAKRNKVGRVVYASSSSAEAKRSPYALQKYVGEEYCRIYSDIHNLETISLRFFNVYGTRMNPDGNYACLIPKHIKLAKQNKDLPVYGSGEQRRDFTSVDDVVSALIKMGEHNHQLKGCVLEVGTGKNYSVNEVDKIILKLTKSKSKIKYLKRKKGESRRTLADIRATKRILNWQPKISLYEGIKKIKDSF